MKKTKTKKSLSTASQLRKLRDAYESKPATLTSILREAKALATYGFSEASWVVNPDFTFGELEPKLKKLGFRVYSHPEYRQGQHGGRVVAISWL